jgi:endonuclease-3
MTDVKKAIELLKKEYPHAKYYLNFSSPLELLVAAMLSPQVRDEIVNATTPKIFKKYKSLEDYAKADLQELTNDIKPISFPAIKAARIKKACQVILEKFKGQIPRSTEELTSIPGIGRKTAASILINAFGIVEGIPVDLHVIRVSYRLGWTKEKNPDKIEKDLMKIIPKDEWKTIAYRLKAHGRAVCGPVPVCGKCVLNRLCPKFGVKGI